ncbi:MAG: ATP-binding protein [Candidatus Dormibacteria bacterium]
MNQHVSDRFRAESSLQWRLPIIFAVILLLVLLLSDGTQYLILRQNLISSKSKVLVQDVNQSRILLDRFFHLESGTPDIIQHACARTQLADQLDTTFARFIANTTGSTVGVVVYDANRQVVDVEPTGAQVPQVQDTYLRRVQTGAVPTPLVLDTAKGQMLVVAVPIAPKLPTACGLVEMSISMDSVDHILRQETGLFILEGIIGFFVAAALGFYLTRRALFPLERLKSAALELAGGNLQTRSQIVPRNDEVGVLAQAFDTMADQIERAFTEQQASEERTKRFIADASHELRTPITALKGYLDVLRRGKVRDPAVLEPALESMSQEAERMRKLVIDLLALVRLDNAPPAAQVPYDVNELLSTILDEGVPSMPENLVRDFASTTLPVLGDPDAFRTVMRNLLVNASTYAKGARQVWTTTRHEGMARIEVHDDGPGIPPEDLPHIFERFYRGEKTRSREDGGSGLGLSIVQGLVESQGGSIKVVSSEGAGTTFTVDLPLTPTG